MAISRPEIANDNATQYDEINLFREPIMSFSTAPDVLLVALSLPSLAPTWRYRHAAGGARNHARLIGGMQALGLIGLAVKITALLLAVNGPWAMTQAALAAGLLLPGLMLLAALLVLALREIRLALASQDAMHAPALRAE
jgi:hypothetical protein